MSKITVVGGIKANVVVYAEAEMMAGQENGGTISNGYGGTGRNIAEKLGRLGMSTTLVAATGNDPVGRGARAELEQLGVDTKYVQLLDQQNTAMDIQVLNLVGDLEFAAVNNDVFNCLTGDMVALAMEQLNASDIVCIDGTVPREVITYLIEQVKAPLFFDPYSAEAAKNSKDIIGKFHTIKPNRAEASAICGMEIFSEEQLKEAGQWLEDQGVKRIFITMSGGGVYYKEGSEEGILRPEEVLSFISEEGAGDAFSAAVLAGMTKGMTVDALAASGMEAAAKALKSKPVSIRR